MTDIPEPVHPPTEELPEDDGSPAIPMTYVDILTTVVRSGPIHKLVFGRYEMLQKPHQISVLRNCTQITIPLDGFVDMYAFLKIQVDSLIERNIINQKDVDELIREKLDDNA